MKKTFLFLAALFISTAITSCLKVGDDDSSSYHTVTSAERYAMLQKIHQSYTGCVKFYNDSSKMDSIAATLSFTSDTVAVMSYPVSLIANYLTFSGADSVRVALRNAPKQDVEFRLYTPSSMLTTYWDSYFSKGVYVDLPFYPLTQTIQFNAGSHTFMVTFSTDYVTYGYNYYYPYFNYSGNRAYAFVLLESIKIDGGSTHEIDTPTEFVGKGM